uniref:DDE Tnp4 domain-containing protein n=1 Tax=Aegilops tauschii TaxID=37682 RepID=N1QQ48_AEGTA
MAPNHCLVPVTWFIFVNCSSIRGPNEDSRVLRDAMRANRQDAFVVPKGKYYLVDVGYTNGEGFLAPFRSTRYHLKEWATRRRNYCAWDDEMDDALLEVFVENHNKGDHAQNGWKPHANKACKEIKSCKSKVIKNWESICIIYSKDHANGEGAKTCAEIAVEPLEEPIEVSLEVALKRQRIGDAILCMLGDMKDLVGAFKKTEPIPLPKVTTPTEILDALRLIPDLAEQDML